MTTKPLRLAGLLAFTFACSGNDGSSASTVDQPITYSAPSILSCAVSTLTLADFNGDGLKDLLSGCPSTVSTGQSVSGVYINRGGGTFGDPIEPGMDWAWVMDVNADGRDDLVTSTEVYPGAADGTFGTPFAANIPGGNTCCDLDGDGRKDVVNESGDSPSTVTAYSVAVDGSTTPIFTFVGSFDALADIDHDGLVDVVSLSGSSVLVRFNMGAGQLADPRVVLGANVDLSEVDTVDIDGDGLVDLVVGLRRDDGYWDFGLARNTGGGAYVQTAIIPGDPSIDDTFVDATGDGKMDVVLSDDNGGLAILPGRGDSTFAAATLVTGPWSRASDIHFADLTGAHKLDLLVGDGSSISVLLRQ